MQILKHKNTKIILISSVMVFVFFDRAPANNTIGNPPEDGGLRIYLPREITVKEPNLTLGQVSVIQGIGMGVITAGLIAIVFSGF